MYFSNVWYAQYLPILSSHAFDNTGAHYNVTRILTPANTLDQSLYEAYSPLFLPTVFAISYGLSFASVTATLSHAFLYFRKQIWVQARRSLHEQPDIHARLMSKYAQVPEWWYLCIFLSMFAIGIISIEVWPTCVFPNNLCDHIFSRFITAKCLSGPLFWHSLSRLSTSFPSE